MPLISHEELARIHDIQIDCFATDVEFEPVLLRGCTEEQLRDFFEMAGEMAPIPTGLIGAQSWWPKFYTLNRQLLGRLETVRCDNVMTPLSSTELADCRKVAADNDDEKLRSYIGASVLRSMALLHSINRTGCVELLGNSFLLARELLTIASPEVQRQDGLDDCIPAKSPEAACAIGVLIIGFGGSEIEQLSPIKAMYTKCFPRWRCVCLTGSVSCSWDAPIEAEPQVFRQALDTVVNELAGCVQLVLHLQSNNSHMFWLRLMKTRGTMFIKRVGAMVLDCGFSRRRFFTPQMHADISMKGLLVGLQRLNLTRVPVDGISLQGDEASWGEPLPNTPSTPVPVTQLLSIAAAHCNASNVMHMAESDEAFEWHIAHEPAVPTLCLTSEGDRVILEAGVRQHATALQAAQPSRKVRIVSIPNCHHVTLHSTNLAEYERSITQLIAESGIVASADSVLYGDHRN
mmetsp:Transcript_7194/g.12116  ORF Transcript_7194/g.12116 Transcript_7194/m.12116 type:complete len:460 (+) Transcript_7194:107-1486(+)